MNNFFKILFTLSIIIFSLTNTQAQKPEYNDNSLNDSEFKFPPLSVVIDSVLKQSAMSNFWEKHIRIKESTLESERLDLTKSISIQGTTSFGNINNFSTNTDGVVNSSVLTATQQFNYSVGLALKVSLFDLLNKKQRIKVARLEIDAAKSMAKSEEEEIRQTVIKLYQNLILKQKLLQIKSRSLGDAQVNMQMVEKKFRNGIVPISEFVRMNSMMTSLQVAYEIAISEFITAKKMLEDLAGFVFGLTLSN